MSKPFRFGSEVLVNTATAGHQLRPDFTALADGRFLAVWTSPDGGVGSGSGFPYGAYG